FRRADADRRADAAPAGARGHRLLGGSHHRTSSGAPRTKTIAKRLNCYVILLPYPRRALSVMRQYFKNLAMKAIGKLADRIAQRVDDSLSHSDELADSVAYRVALETMDNNSVSFKKPKDLFQGTSDGLWFWLCTEGYRRSPRPRNVLPGIPEERVQLMF